MNQTTNEYRADVKMKIGDLEREGRLCYGSYEECTGAIRGLQNFFMILCEGTMTKAFMVGFELFEFSNETLGLSFEAKVSPRV